LENGDGVFLGRGKKMELQYYSSSTFWIVTSIHLDIIKKSLTALVHFWGGKLQHI